MLKYTDVCVTFAEIPDEINLCINISNCDGTCTSCHTPELRQDIGQDLTTDILHILKQYHDITCVVFMGEGRKQGDTRVEWLHLTEMIRFFHPELKLALYSGRSEVEEDLWWMWDYIKVGPYIPECGPLDSPTTNQHLFVNDREEKQKTDITYKFQGGGI